MPKPQPVHLLGGRQTEPARIRRQRRPSRGQRLIPQVIRAHFNGGVPPLGETGRRCGILRHRIGIPDMVCENVRVGMHRKHRSILGGRPRQLNTAALFIAWIHTADQSGRRIQVSNPLRRLMFTDHPGAHIGVVAGSGCTGGTQYTHHPCTQYTVHQSVPTTGIPRPAGMSEGGRRISSIPRRGRSLPPDDGMRGRRYRYSP